MFGFNTAFSYLMQGKRVRRKSWYPGAFIEVMEGQIVDEEWHDFSDICNSSSLLADDWELVD